MPHTADSGGAGVSDWAKRIPLAQIPAVLAFLSARLVSEDAKTRDEAYDSSATRESVTMLTAGELARCLNLPESWIRNAGRLGHIPAVKIGKYVRFRLSEVSEALAKSEAFKS
jgi:excisionase family DNA binding protein